MASKKVSIDEVAKLAGVSVTTVSRVINKFPGVSKKSRKAVLDVIAKMGYQPSSVAQRLATGRTNAIGLVIPRYEGIFYSFASLEIIRAMGMLCDSMKFDFLFHITDGKTFINPSTVGGIIFCDIIGNNEQLGQAKELAIPFILINHYIDDNTVSCIAIDNLDGAKKAVEYLVKLGHRRIAHITGDLNAQSAQQRLKGYREILDKNGIEINQDYIIKSDYTRGKARTATEKLLNLPQVPTAIFAASDSMALEAIGVLTEKKISVPKDISVIGFDDNPSGLYGQIALTTVKQPLVEMVKIAINELDAMIKGRAGNIKKVLLPTELVVRDSCAEVKQQGD